MRAQLPCPKVGSGKCGANEFSGYSDNTIGVLRELGYAVLEAANGRSALEMLQAHNNVDLLFTDVVLPEGMDGRHPSNEVARQRPGIKVLFTTGYGRNAIVHNGSLDAGVQLITKPFSFAELAAKIRAILDT